MNSESWLRTQYQNIIKERDDLQLKYNQLINENFDLKRAVFELSQQIIHQRVSYNSSFNNLSSNPYPSSLPPSILSPPSTSLPLPPTLYYNQNNKQFQFNDPSSSSSSPSSSSLFNKTTNIRNQNLIFSDDNFHLKNKINDDRTLNFECELRGHNGAIYCVDISSNNRWIASGSFDKTIVIWKGNFPYKQVAVLSGHTQLVSGLCWGPDPLPTSTTTTSSTSATSKQDKKNEPSAPILFSTSFDKTVIYSSFQFFCLFLLFFLFDLSDRFVFGIQLKEFV